jgi:TonB-dependent receptor
MSFKKNILSSSIAVAMIGSVTPAFAEDGAIEEVIVEGGIRASLLKSIDRKRNATGVVDAITAEDMGKFPDTNLAESLQRITGVSINRSNGEGSQITVRGMGPEFNLVTLNGRQMPTVGGRSFEFSNIATEAVSAVEVYKTTDASMPTGGIGATVNMETAKPLDNPGFSGVLSGKAVMDTSNVNGDDVTPEVAGVFSNTFADDTIGVLLSASYQDRDNREQYAAVDNWMPRATPEAGWGNDNITDNNTREDGMTWYPQNAGYNIADNSRQRQNSQLVLQFAPNDSMTTTLDYTNSKVEFEGERRGFGIWFGNAATDTATINENGTHTFVQEPGGDYANNLARGAYQNRNESLGLNIEWQASDNLTLTFDAHDSSAITQGMGLGNDAYLITGNTSGAGFDDPAANTANIDLKNATYASSGIPVWDISFVDVNGNPQTELQGSDIGSLFAGIVDDYAENEMSQYQLDGVWENAGDGALQSIGFGVAKTEQNFKSTGADSGQLPAGWWGYSAMFWDDDMWVKKSTDGLLDGFGNGGDFPVGYYMDATFDEVAYGYENIIDDAEYWGQCCYAASWPAELGGKLGAGPIDTDARVNEEVTSVYVQANFEDEFNGMPITTVAGLRYEESEVNSNGLELPAVDMKWVGGNEWSYIFADEQVRSYGSGETKEFLPSLSMSMDITDQLTSRFAYSRSLARPPINSLRSTTNFNGNPKVGQRKVSVGNPQLKPYISDNIDLSLEYYYDEGSYVSAGYFKKIVDNFLVTTTSKQTYPGLRDAYLGERAEEARAQIINSGDAVRDPDLHELINVNQGALVADEIFPNETDPLTIFDVSTDSNAEIGNLYGWEIAAQHMFADTGWGVVANATVVNGDVNADRDVVDVQFALPGMSDSANLSVFYEKDQVSARVSYNWRDEYLNGFDQHSSPVFNEAYSQVDLSASYQVNDDLQLFVEGLNVTDQVQRAYVRYTEQLIRGSQYGPLYNLGARYTF